MLAETFAEIERLTAKYQLKVGTFGHAGDGKPASNGLVRRAE